MTFNKQKSAGYLINHLARLFAANLQQEMKIHGLAPAQFMTLLELWEKDGLTQKQLVARLDVEQATMANTINRMERDGWIVRKPHPDDRRSQQIFLTSKAKAIQAEATSVAKSVNQKALGGLSGDEQAQFINLANRVIAGLRD